MTHTEIGRASADLRDAILKHLGRPVPIRLPGPKQRFVQRKKSRPSKIIQSCNKVEQIKRMVSEYYDISEALINAPTRCCPEAAEARQIAIYLSRKLTNHSFPNLGRLFRRDHSTIIHANRAVARLIANDTEVQADIERLTEALEA